MDIINKEIKCNCKVEIYFWVLIDKMLLNILKLNGFYIIYIYVYIV